MSEQQLARHWNKSVRTLQRWRKEGCGLAYFRVGQTIYYRIEDILAHEASSRSGAGEAQ
jgi:hypothetical protein